MRAYDLYRQIEKEYQKSDLEKQAKIEGRLDELNEFYDELHDFCYVRALKEDFTDEEFKNDFYEKQDGEVIKPKIGDYMLIVFFEPIYKDPKPMRLIIKRIKREEDIEPTDKSRIRVSSKYFEDNESLKAFIIKIKMNHSDKYRIDIEYENN